MKQNLTPQDVTPDVIEAAAKMLGDDHPETFSNRLLCQSQGLEKRRDFIELTAKLVVNLPGE